MKHKEQFEISIPTFYLSWLINTDNSGYEGNELTEVQDFEKEQLQGFEHVVYDPFFKEDNEAYFGQFNGIGHELTDVLITKY